MALSEVVVDLVAAQDENRFRALMQAHHYLGALPGVGETFRYVAHHRGQWLALVVFSAPVLKCAARDRWIGWSFGVQFDRLHLLTNNSRFLLLPGAPRNLGSRVLLSGVEKRDGMLRAADAATNHAGTRSTLFGFVARTADSRHSFAPIRLCWISTAFGLMTNSLRVPHMQSRRLRLSPRTLRLG